MSNDLRGKWKEFSAEQARGLIEHPESPLADFPVKFVWHTGPWYDVFQLQIEKLRRDIGRAKAEGRLAIYLSCPISSRGGGYSTTNVDVARHVERVLLERWGEGFWVLNPAQYQLESKAGTGLMNEHAEYLGLDLHRLIEVAGRPLGGDYMRMWTTVLAENDRLIGSREVTPNTGQNFDAFYFLGPRDVHSFFLSEGETLTAGIQAYFARKFATDPDFREEYSDPEPSWSRLGPRTAINEDAYRLRDLWNNKRVDFLRYYGLRASVTYSLGSHDEWLIFRAINELRRRSTRGPAMVDGDVGEQIAGFFDGGQIDMASAESSVSHGYSK
ncbi:hypothetical protein [Rhodopseudomonas sp. B29]|uniref:hypothetical protein n=1 Tax=Rhodopseudomonas sp. B29 TaxID=95607 RepID=UPI0003B47457|nr:hypothetical protein [Rhodopseudomonas sp. B29]